VAKKEGPNKWSSKSCNFISNPKQSSCKKSVWLPRMLLWKKMWNPKWAVMAGGLKAKILIPTIQVNLCCLLHISLWFGTKFIWIVVIKFFAISLPSQPFLSRHFGFHIFFTSSFLRASHFFYNCMGCFWIRFHFVLLFQIINLADYMLVIICLIHMYSVAVWKVLMVLCTCISLFYNLCKNFRCWCI